MPRKTNRIESLVFNQTEFAELIGASKASVTGWKKEGLPTNADGSIPVKLALAWWLDRELSAASGEAGSEWLERWRKARALREEISLERERGELVSASELEARWADHATYARSSLMSMVGAIAPAVAGMNAHEASDLLETHLRRVCDMLADDADDRFGKDMPEGPAERNN